MQQTCTKSRKQSITSIKLDYLNGKARARKYKLCISSNYKNLGNNIEQKNTNATNQESIFQFKLNNV